MSIKASTKRYRLSNFKLKALLEITKAINDNKSTDELLDQYEILLKEDLAIGKVLIYKYVDGWECILKSGVYKFEESKLDFEKELLPHKKIRFIPTRIESELSIFDIIIPVYNNDKPLAYVLIGDLDEEGDGVSPTIKHLNFIQTVSNIIIVAIENIRLFSESLRQEALKKELELASQMQGMLIPNNEHLPKKDDICIESFYYPHMDVGGDYYDVIELNDYEVGFCIADVSGKGISAALLMSNFQANLKAMFTHDISLVNLVERLNDRVLESAKGEKFITMFIARYNRRTKQLEYVNAGHNPPILFETNSQKFTHLKYGCVGMGMLDELPLVQTGLIHVKERTKLMCFTDGLVELAEHQEVEYDTEVIEHALNNTDPIQANIKQLIQSQSILEKNELIFDDITILGVEMA